MQPKEDGGAATPDRTGWRKVVCGLCFVGTEKATSSEVKVK